MFKIIIISTFLTSFISCQSIRRKEKAIIDDLLTRNYDHKILPETYSYYYNELTDKSMIFDFKNQDKSYGVSDNSDNSTINSNTRAVIDTIDTYLRNVYKISAMKQTIEVQLTFRQRWRDKNLEYKVPEVKSINLNPDHKIWKPDLFISNEMDGNFHNLLEPNSLIRLYQNGSVLYSVRVTLKLFCPMDFKYFPFDSQMCPIRFAVYGHTTDDIILRWKEGDPFQVSKSVKNTFINHMRLVKAMTRKCTAKTNTGEYSCLSLDLIFERNSKFYICRWFLPSSLSILIVWLSFWLSKIHSNARIGLLIASTLMLSCVSKDIRDNKPELDYCTTIDVWLMTCWLFVIVGYIRYGLVQYFNDKKENDPKCDHKQEDQKEKEKLIPDNKLQLIRQKWHKKSCISKLDFASIVGFPVLFILIQSIVLLSHINLL